MSQLGPVQRKRDSVNIFVESLCKLGNVSLELTCSLRKSSTLASDIVKVVRHFLLCRFLTVNVTTSTEWFKVAISSILMSCGVCVCGKFRNS